MPLPPLNRLRKGVVFFTVLLFVFVLSRLFFIKKNDSFLPEEEAPDVHTRMCLMVTPGGPVNVDTVFYLKNRMSKIFAYSSLAEDFNLSDTLWHIWYYNSEKVKSIPCTLNNSGCYSSLSADSLRKGDWSLDVRQNEILMNIRQFRVED